jgi:hypothetical protein
MLTLISVSARTLVIEGVMTTESFKPGEHTPAESKSASFVLRMQDCRWNIQVREFNSHFDLFESGSDGTNIYSLIRFSSYVQQNHNDGNVVGVNSASGFVDCGPVPHNYWEEDIPVLWLAYCSSCYLSSISNHMAEPILFYVRQDRKLHRIGFTQRTEWEPIAGGGMPACVAYFSDGKMRRWKEGLAGYVPPEETTWPPPYEKGFTNSYYRVDQSTHFEGTILPTKFSFSVLHPREHGSTAGDLDLVHRFTGIATNISALSHIKELLPKVDGVITVADERFSRDAQPVFRMEYLVTNQWLTDHEAKQIAYYKNERHLEAFKQPYIIQKARSYSSHRLLIYITFIIVGIVPLCIFVFLRSRAGWKARFPRPREKLQTTNER